jgi:hypothetical protein
MRGQGYFFSEPLAPARVPAFFHGPLPLRPAETQQDGTG